MDYIVIPPETSAWTMEIEAFRAALLVRWPDVLLRGIRDSDPTYALDFTILEPRRVDGAFGGDGQVLGLAGDLGAVVTVAVWFRGLVPEEQRLVFCDPALNGQVELTPDAEPEQVAVAYLGDAT